MISVFIQSVGIAGPGLKGWHEARDILAGAQQYLAAEYQPSANSILPKNEYRRTTRLVKLALTAAQDATGDPLCDTSELAAVFTSADGDLDITNKVCQALTLPDRPVSPTHFHNSVHNAPAGYWSIATGSHAPSTSICACDFTFAAGLVEAACQAQQDKIPVLLVAYDHVAPFPLCEKRSYKDPFAVALLLSSENHKRNICEIRLSVCQKSNNNLTLDQAEIIIPIDNPNACALPLLQAMSTTTDRDLELDYNHEQQLNISIRHANNS